MTGSNYYVQENCFASSQMGEQAEALGKAPVEENEDTLRGTRSHAAIETGDLSELEDQNEIDQVQSVSQRSASALQAFAAEDPIRVIPEERIFLREGLEPIYSGQPDRVFVFGKRILFQEFKFAFHAEWAKWHAQRRAYAVLLYQDLGVNDITGQIIPMYGSTDSFHFSNVELASQYGRLLRVISEHKADAPPVTPGDWCRWCKGRFVCKQAFLPSEPDSFPLSICPDRLPSGIPGAEVVRKLKAGIKLSEEILEWYKIELSKDAGFLDREIILRDGRQYPYVKDPLEVSRRLSKHLTSDEQSECIKFSPAKIRNKIREKYDCSEEVANTILKTALGDLLAYKQGSPVLAEGKKK